MPTYPIRAARDPYRGNNPSRKERQREFHRQCERIEQYVNAKVAASSAEEVLILYGDIANDLHLPLDVVEDALRPLDCGHTGITVRRLVRN